MNDIQQYKEEFVKNVADELSEIEEGLKVLHSKRIFLIDTHAKNFYNTKDIDRVEFQMNILRARKTVIEGLVDYYSYFRIKNMTDLEIEEYRIAKVNEYNLKIEEQNREKEKAEKEYIELKDELDILGKNYISMNSKEKEAALKRSAEIRSILIKYESKSEYGTFTVFEKTIKKLIEDKQELSNKSNQELKDTKLSEIEKRNTIESILSNMEKYGISPLYKLFGALANDPEKVEKVIDLLENNSDLFNIFNDDSVKFKIDENIPYGIRNKFRFYNYLNNDGVAKINNVESFKTVLAKAKTEFNENKEKLSNELTREKLYKLAENYRNQDGIDYEFLKLHEDKFDKDLLNEYMYNDEQRRNNLKGIKRLFRGNIEEAEVYENKANKQKEMIYSSITSWYLNQFPNVISKGINHWIFETETSINKFLNEFPENVLVSENALNGLSEQVDKEIEKNTLRKKVIEDKINALRVNIYELAGQELKEPLATITYRRPQNVYETMVSAYTEVFLSNYIKKLEEEAKESANKWKEEAGNKDKLDSSDQRVTYTETDPNTGEKKSGEFVLNMEPVLLNDKEAETFSPIPLDETAKKILEPIALAETAKQSEVDDGTKVYTPTHRSSFLEEIKDMSPDQIREYLSEVVNDMPNGEINIGEEPPQGPHR